MDKRIIKVNSENKGKRLDKFILEQFPQYSRSHIQKQIKEGNITLNGKKIAVHTFLKESDCVQAEPADPVKMSLGPETEIKLNIIYEDTDFIVVNKQAGIAVHPSLSTPQHTLVNALLAYYPAIASVGEDATRPGIVHRLDKDVSGLMVIAKNQKSFDYLKTQFEERKVEKKYQALVHGRMNPPNGTIAHNIGRSADKPYRMAVKKEGEGKTAITAYKTLDYYKDYSLLEIATKTGRTHQIRVHLFSLGHSIIGDEIYAINKVKQKNSLGRVFLHACYLKFTGMDGITREFSAKLPDEQDDFLTKLKNKL